MKSYLIIVLLALVSCSSEGKPNAPPPVEVVSRYLGVLRGTDTSGPSPEFPVKAIFINRYSDGTIDFYQNGDAIPLEIQRVDAEDLLMVTKEKGYVVYMGSFASADSLSGTFFGANGYLVGVWEVTRRYE